MYRRSRRLPWALALAMPGCFSPDAPPLATDTEIGGSSSGSSGLPPDGTTTGGSDETAEPPACADPMLQCGADCIDPNVDAAHCGACDSPCADNEECSGGSCTVVCDGDVQDCGGSCVDTDTDPAHCGGCDSPCAAGEICDTGTCVLDCMPGLTPCGEDCVDIASDDAHCGGCDSPCGPGEFCDAELCVPSCPPGQVECAGACIDPLLDLNNCGAGLDCVAQPGVQCIAPEICNGGMCEVVGCAGFTAAAFDPALTFPEIIPDNTVVGIAWDGVVYWSAAGGSSGGQSEGQHNGAGAAIATFVTGIDFRSVFTQGDGTPDVYARGFSDPTILIQDSPGVFIDFIDLIGGALDSQSSVAWDPVANEFIAFNLGTLERWDSAGGYVGSTAFIDYGVNPGENDFPQNRGVAWANGCYLTYNSGSLSAWDTMGTRVDTATLNGGGGGLDSNLSLSFANSHVFVSDGVEWRGYDVF